MHIVFDADDETSLTKSFDLDDSLADDIMILKEDWSVGPLKNVENGDTEITRAEWMSALTAGIETPAGAKLEDVRSYLDADPEKNAWIWIAPNSRDVSNYYYLVSNLRSYQGRLFTIWLNNLPFINEKGQVFYPAYLKEIPPREFVKCKRLVLEITPAVFETDPDEWHKLVEQNSFLRILEGAKKLSGKNADYFDKDILAQLQGDWLKSNKIIQLVRSKSTHAPGRLFLLWRLRELINTQGMEARGDWASSDNFEVRKIQSSQKSEADE